MRKILLIKKDGENIHVVAEMFKLNPTTKVELKEKSTGALVSIWEMRYKLTRLEEGKEGEVIGFIPKTDGGEVNFYENIDKRCCENDCQVELNDTILWVKKDKINILELVYYM